MLKVGDKAPLFSLPDQDQKVVSLSDYIGSKTVVLFFYPKDNTTGCTAESCSFRDSEPDFSQYDAQILGVSGDDAHSHQNFIAKHRLSYPLLSDVDFSVATSFGLKKTLGLIPARATFVIDKNGIIQMAFSSQFRVKTHSEEALAVAKRLCTDPSLRTQ